MGRIARFLTLAMAALAGFAHADDAVIVLDGSGSMWGRVENRAKVEIAREVMAEVIRDWPAGTELGLFAYGHRRKGDCGDIERLIEVGPVEPDAFLTTFNAVSPKGKTPLTAAVERAADALRYTEERATVILLSDGIETCHRDPCEAAAALERTGVDFTAHVIGFDVGREDDRAQLRCLAENTGGRFLTAATAGELMEALSALKAETARPEPEPEPPVEVVVDAPAEATVGERFEVSWTPTVDGSDYLTVVPAGAEPHQIGNHRRAGERDAVALRAPQDPGRYEVRYVRNAGKQVLGRDAIELVEGRVSLEAPPEATVGSRIDVAFDKTIHEADFLTIVPADAADDTVGNHKRAGAGSPVRLRVPGEPGAYEVRYVLEEGRRTLARAPVELVEARVAVTAPDTAVTGATVEVAWDRTVDDADFVTVVPVDAPEDTVGNHKRAGAGTPAELRVPAETGVYEVRYVLEEGRRTLGRTRLEATPPRVEVTAPERVSAGAAFEVSWRGTVHRADFITVVPADAPDDKVGNHRRANEENSGALRAPGEAGAYEVRYVLEEGRRTLARSPLRVTEPEVAVEAPATTVAGAVLEVSWAGTVHEADFITIVPADAPDDEVGNHRRAGEETSGGLRVPGKAGDYEVRYVLEAGRRTLARAPVRAAAPEVALKAPNGAEPGGAVEVAWTPTVHHADFITIVPKGAPADRVGTHERAGAGSPVTLQAPEKAGAYEVRYVLEEGRRIVARAPLTVE